MKSWEIASYSFVLLVFIGVFWGMYAFNTGGWAAARLPLSLTISAAIVGLGINSWGEARERGVAAVIASLISIVIVQAVIFGIDWFTRGR